MSITAKAGAAVVMMIVLAMGLAACQTSGTVTSIASDEGDVSLPSWLAKPEGGRPLPRRRSAARLHRDSRGTPRIRPSGAA